MTICLATLARDDADRIGRLLESAAPICDRMLVIDTGSTDATAEMAASYGATVLWREWVNAGHNRTELVRLAREQADYVLALDSDEELVIHEAPLPQLEAACYQLQVRHQTLRFGFPKLLRSDIDWRYVGRAHEYLEPILPQDPLKALSVIHYHDRGDVTAKLTGIRDQLALTLAEDPTNARAVFYLAQTYRDMGDTQRAISHYRLRASMGGWEEEAWYAAYEAARLNRDPQALLDAWQRRPWRYEPLYKLSRLSRELADATQPDPDGDVLFIGDRP